MTEQEWRFDHGVGPAPAYYQDRCRKPGHRDHPLPCQACRTEREGGDGGTALQAMLAAVRAGGDR